MDQFFSLFARHGYAVLAAIVFLEAIGLPVPAAVALLATGGGVRAARVESVDGFDDRRYGDCLRRYHHVLRGGSFRVGTFGFLCRVSMNPETCILRSAESFYKRGKATLLIAKFVPGLNTMAPPLAGSMKMPAWKFLRYDLGGAFLYVLAYGGAGFLFSDFMKSITRGLALASHTFELFLLAAAVAYVAYRIWAYKQQRVYRIVPRIEVGDLVALYNSDERERMIIADVRSHGYYDEGAHRIHGSIRIEPNNLDEEMDKLPRDKHIYLYCT